MGLPFILPAASPFEAYSGADFEKALQYKKDVSGTVSPVNITGWTFSADIREKYSSVDPVVSLTTGGGGLPITDAALGKFKMVLTDVQTKLFPIPLKSSITTNVPFKDFVFDIFATKPDGTVIPFMRGVLRVYAGATRD